MSSQRTSHVDTDRTLILADASLLVYNAFTKKPDITAPPGYQVAHTWSGVDPYGIFFKRDEPFGVVFTKLDDPGTVIFAFRGTDSFLDAWEDLFFNTATFVPASNATPDTAVQVADGFWDIYSTSAANIPSQQQQLFALYDQLKPTTLMITGHSLGSALATLFTLDLSLSRPNAMPKTTYSQNFASPRVGLADFAALYARQPLQKDSATRTIRVVNYYDYVPSLPPHTVIGYEHIGDYFLAAFFKKGAYIPHADVRHSMFDYNAVLEQALPLRDQIFVGTVVGVDNILLRSVAPPADAAPTNLSAFGIARLDGINPSPITSS